MSTPKGTNKKLKPDGIKAQTIFAALGISREILLGLILQNHIPTKLTPIGLDDRRVRRLKEGELITHQGTTRMLGIALDYCDLFEDRILAYEITLKKIDAKVSELFNVLKKNESSGRTINKSMKENIELVVIEHYNNHKKFITAEALSRKISRQIFNNDPEKYKIAGEKKAKKISKDLPTGWQTQKNWAFFELHYRPLPIRTAGKYLKEIKENWDKK